MQFQLEVRSKKEIPSFFSKPSQGKKAGRQSQTAWWALLVQRDPLPFHYHGKTSFPFVRESGEGSRLAKNACGPESSLTCTFYFFLSPPVLKWTKNSPGSRFAILVGLRSLFFLLSSPLPPHTFLFICTGTVTFMNARCLWCFSQKIEYELIN